MEKTTTAPKAQTVNILPKHGVTGLLLSEEEVDLFLDYLVETDPEPARIHTQGEKSENKSIRDAETRFIDEKQTRLYRILNKVAMSANKHFKYDINGIERAQIITYKAPSNGYEYHMDIGPEGTAATRKISMSLVLNDDFEGGATLYEDTTEAKRFAAVAPARGRVVLFEHDLWHSGAPVTAGTKLVLRTDVLFDAAAPKPPPAPAQSRDRAKGVRGLADAVAPDLADALDAIGLLDCGVESLLAPGREAYAAMLADAPDSQVDRLWAAAVAEASALPVAPANTRAVVT